VRGIAICALMIGAAHAGPMTALPDSTAVCKELTASDPKATCKSVMGSTVKDFGNVQLYVATGEARRYALVATVGGKLWRSEPLVLAPSGDVLDASKPALRVVTARGRAYAVAVIAQSYHHDKDRWSVTTLIACGPKAEGGGATCNTRTWGGRGNSCKLKLGADAQLIASCDTRDAIAIE